MTDEEKEEYERCKNDLIYFYENYAAINGRRVNPLTDAQKEILCDCHIQYLAKDEIVEKYGKHLTQKQIDALDKLI